MVQNQWFGVFHSSLFGYNIPGVDGNNKGLPGHTFKPVKGLIALKDMSHS